jgi:cell division protein FtsQ
VLAHNSVDRDVMARDSIELTQYEDLVSPSRGKPRGSSSLKNDQQSAVGYPEVRLGASRRNDEPGPANRRARSRASGVRNEDDSELIINPEDMNLEDLDGEEEQFLRTERRVPVRRSAIPKKAASQLKIAAIASAAVVLVAGLWAMTYSYGMHSWRFRINSSDAVEIAGVRNASRAQVMEVAGADIGRNVFFVPLDERKRQLEQIPWVEQASVMRLLPNRISVTIQERTPVAFVQIGSRTSLIDAGGVVMGMPANRQTRYSFPVIRGITESEPLSSRAAAMKIYNRLVGELGMASGETAGTISSVNGGTGYVRQLSEVDLSDPEDVKVTANDPGGTMVVHLGAQDFLARYKLYVAHISEWRQQFQNVQSVDLRYEGQVIVNPDKPAAPDKPLPRANADNTVPKKAVLRTVSHRVTPKAKKHSPQRTQRAQR